MRDGGSALAEAPYLGADRPDSDAMRATYSPDCQKPVILDARFAPLEGRASNYTSQFGEDGLIAAIFDLIGVKHRACFEIGATDGEFFSNTKTLRDAGWSAVLVEANAADFESLSRFASADVRTVHRHIDGQNTIDACVGEHFQRFDLGSIDIDGGDLKAWAAMQSIRPRVMVVECEYLDGSYSGHSTFEDVSLVAEAKGYTPVVRTFCNLICVASEEMPTGAAEDVSPKPATAKAPQQIRIAAVMSLPRVGWNDAWGCAFDALRPFGIPIRRTVGGVFWGQWMQRMLEGCVADGLDWVLTIDYDTMFTPEQLDGLIGHFGSRPDIDALAALQVQRITDAPLMGRIGQSRVEHTGYHPIKVDSAHFGLTLIRVDALKLLPKPWFVAKPDANGEWTDARIDDDIHFWNQWRLAGKSVFVDPGCRVGHLQLMVSSYDDDIQLRHQHVDSWRQEQKRVCQSNPRLEKPANGSAV